MLRRLLEPIKNRTIPFETRVKTVVLALLVLPVMSENLRQLAGMLRLGMDPAVDEVSRHEKRLEPLRKALPQRGVVGYMTDAPSRREITERYHMTSYALAPLVVVRSADRPLVVGDFANAPTAKLNSSVPLRVREDFGNGVLLFAEEER